jgi:hypothetical protein
MLQQNLMLLLWRRLPSVVEVPVAVATAEVVALTLMLVVLPLLRLVLLALLVEVEGLEVEEAVLVVPHTHHPLLLVA